MNEDTYLNNVLNSQDLDPDGEEMKNLQNHRQDVEGLLRVKFPDASSTIRYGGSKAKGTMIKESYDLDIVFYIPHGNDTVGKSLKEIYDNVYCVLIDDYYVERKASALRLKDKNPEEFGTDFHIDVVPGRYIDDTKTDVYLYRSTGEKERQKTNLEVHMIHIKDSGVVQAIRLMKLWKVKNAISIKNFVFELLVIDILENHKKKTLANQLRIVWEEFQDNYQNLCVEDPANPSGNDLSQELSEVVRWNLHSDSEWTMSTLEKEGWEAIFPLPDKDKEENLPLEVITPRVIRSSPASPWSNY